MVTYAFSHKVEAEIDGYICISADLSVCVCLFQTHEDVCSVNLLAGFQKLEICAALVDVGQDDQTLLLTAEMRDRGPGGLGKCGRPRHAAAEVQPALQEG